MSGLSFYVGYFCFFYIVVGSFRSFLGHFKIVFDRFSLFLTLVSTTTGNSETVLWHIMGQWSGG